MSLEKSAEFKREDLDRLKMFKVLVESASYDVKGDAFLRIASLMMWFNGLETKIEANLAKKGAPKIKEMDK